MRAALFAMLVAGCGGQAATPEPPRVAVARDAGAAAPVVTDETSSEDSLGIDWASEPLASDEDALSVWRKLGLHGENWVDRLSLVPETGRIREVLAKALLRHGDFACERVDQDLGCGQVESQIREPTAADDFASPCLRRLLALWALEELDDDVLLDELQADLVAIAGLPPPEGELNRAAFRRVREDDVLLKMLAAAKRAGNHEVADEAATQLSDVGLVEAGIDLHIDGAIEAADPGTSTKLFLHALVDPKLRPITRKRVVYALGEWAANLEPQDPERAPLIEGLSAAATSGDCVIAGHAAEQLEMSGAKVPAGPATRDLRALLWATCRIAAPDQTDPKAYKLVIDPRGVVIKRHVERAPERLAPAERDDPDFVPDDDDELALEDVGVPAVERWPLDDSFELPFRDELLRALPGCTTAECAVPNSGVSFRFGTRKGAKGRLVIHTIERFEKPFDC